MRQSIASCRIHDLPRPSLYGLETWKHRLGKWSLKAAAYTCSLTQFPPTPSSLYDFQAAAATFSDMGPFLDFWDYNPIPIPP